MREKLIKQIELQGFDSKRPLPIVSLEDFFEGWVFGEPQVAPKLKDGYKVLVLV